MPFNCIAHSSLAVFLFLLRDELIMNDTKAICNCRIYRFNYYHLKAYYSYSQELGRVIQFPLNIPTYLKLTESIQPIFILL